MHIHHPYKVHEAYAILQIHMHTIVKFVRLRFAEESSRDISHICLLKFIVLAVISINANKVEGFDNSIEIETHAYKTVDEIFIISLVSDWQ